MESTKTHTTAKRFAAVVVLALAASACGGNDAGDALVEPTASSGDPTADAPGPADGNNDGSAVDGSAVGDSDEPETLEDYLGTGFFSLDPQEAAANYARQEQQVQELIAQCMSQEGFEYVAATRPVDDRGIGVPGDVEFAREFGFGVSTLHGETGTLSESDWVDPNSAIVESLSESERGAYYDTLYGSSNTFGDFGSASDSADASGGASTEVEVAEPAFDGCSGTAYQEVYAYEELQELYEQLDLESLADRVQADPRAAEINAEWSECMAERGYDYDDPNAMYEAVYTDLYTRYENIVGSSGGFFDPFEGMSEAEIEALLTDLSQEELDDLYSQAQQTGRQDVDQQALAALQAEERALAVDNAECSQGLVEQFLELYREYEAALVDDNRALLEQFRESREG